MTVSFLKVGQTVEVTLSLFFCFFSPYVANIFYILIGDLDSQMTLTCPFLLDLIFLIRMKRFLQKKLSSVLFFETKNSDHQVFLAALNLRAEGSLVVIKNVESSVLYIIWSKMLFTISLA